MYGQNPYSQYPYTGYTYPNYGNRQFMQPQQQQMAQPQAQMQQQQPMQPVMPTICYAKMEEAKPFIITSANSSMLFIDREKNKALLKTTDNMCASYSRYFDINETDENGNPLQQQEPTQQIDYGKFLTKEELPKYGFVTKDQFNAVLDKLELMQKQIAKGVKENVAGTNNAKQGA